MKKKKNIIMKKINSAEGKFKESQEKNLKIIS